MVSCTKVSFALADVQCIVIGFLIVGVLVSFNFSLRGSLQSKHIFEYVYDASLSGFGTPQTEWMT